MQLLIVLMKENVMKKKLAYMTLIILMLISQTVTGFSQSDNSIDWIQFRGPDRSGISTEKIEVPNTTGLQPELVWKKEIGSAFSEILVSNAIIYTMESEKTDSVSGFEYISAFEESTGNQLWKSMVDSIFIDVDGWGDGPRSTPAIDDKNIYSFSAKGKLTANSLKNGKQIWQIDFVAEYGSTIPRWGFSSSPIIVDDKLIMEVGGIDSKAFMAFNKNNGKVIWEKGNGSASYNSPLEITIDGQQQIIFTNGTSLYSYNTDGDTLWTYQMPIRSITPMPVFIAPNMLFVSGVRTPGFFIIKIEDNKPVNVTSGSSMKNDYNSSCYYNGNIYGFHVAALRCISADSGYVKWTKRGMGKGSLIIVDDKLFVLSDKGVLSIAEAVPDAYKEVASIQAIEGKSWTAPSFVDGKVYVRNLTEMAVYKIK